MLGITHNITLDIKRDIMSDIMTYVNYDMLVCAILSICYVMYVTCVMLRMIFLAHLRLRLPERLRLRPFPPFLPLLRDRERFLPPTAGIIFVCGILT